jgi:hypothetical protein
VAAIKRQRTAATVTTHGSIYSRGFEIIVVMTVLEFLGRQIAVEAYQSESVKIGP